MVGPETSLDSNFKSPASCNYLKVYFTDRRYDEDVERVWCRHGIHLFPASCNYLKYFFTDRRYDEDVERVRCRHGLHLCAASCGVCTGCSGRPLGVWCRGINLNYYLLLNLLSALTFSTSTLHISGSILIQLDMHDSWDKGFCYYKMGKNKIFFSETRLQINQLDIWKLCWFTQVTFLKGRLGHFYAL